MKNALDLTRNALCTDKELPVRVEAAIALQMLLTEQDKGVKLLKISGCGKEETYI